MRQTEQRRLILEELQACARDGHHPAADEVYVRVRKRLPRISLATVYRNLELLAAGGRIGRLEAGGRQMRFDGLGQAHSHFRCTRCGRMEDLPFDVPLPRLDPRHPWVRARSIQGGKPEYYGLCPACVGRSPARRSPRNRAAPPKTPSADASAQGRDKGTNGRVTP